MREQPRIHSQQRSTLDARPPPPFRRVADPLTGMVEMLVNLFKIDCSDGMPLSNERVGLSVKH